jgi:hypothetical protein
MQLSEKFDPISSPNHIELIAAPREVRQVGLAECR